MRSGLPSSLLGAAVSEGTCRPLGTDPLLRENLGEGVELAADDREALVSVARVGRFRICEGGEVIVERDPRATEGELGVWLNGLVAVMLLGQQGCAALHASALKVSGVTLAVAGSGGAGKSTTALELARRGHSLLADDVLPVRRSDGGGGSEFFVEPFGRPFHLSAESFASVGMTVPAGARSSPKSEKLEVPLAPAPHSGLDAIVVLEVVPQPAEGAHGVRTEPVAPVAAIALLTEHASASHLHRRLWPEQLFRWSSGLASSVPVYRLARPGGRRTVREVGDAVEQLVADLVTPGRVAAPALTVPPASRSARPR